MSSEGEQLAAVLVHISTQVLQELADLPEELLNRRVDLPEANTLFALATHLVGAAEFWSLSMVDGRGLARDREGEFVATGTFAQLESRFSAWSTAVRELLCARSPEQLDQLVELTSEQSGALGDQLPTLRACVLHAIEHSALHLGHIQLTRTLVSSSQPAPLIDGSRS